jgi:vacuole morphology and inheritance protein 14
MSNKQHQQSNNAMSDTASTSSTTTTTQLLDNTSSLPFTFSVSIVRNLSDRMKDKRRLGGDEIEALVRKMYANKDEQGVKQVMLTLNSQFINSVQPNMRKGGLWGLASVSVALNYRGIAHFVDELVPPVLSCFADHDSKVRFHACEAMYNIAKVARGHTLKYFNQIFDNLCKVSTHTIIINNHSVVSCQQIQIMQ